MGPRNQEKTKTFLAKTRSHRVRKEIQKMKRRECRSFSVLFSWRILRLGDFARNAFLEFLVGICAARIEFAQLFSSAVKRAVQEKKSA
jgi:hypothetical protein